MVNLESFWTEKKNNNKKLCTLNILYTKGRKHAENRFAPSFFCSKERTVIPNVSE